MHTAVPVGMERGTGIMEELGQSGVRAEMGKRKERTVTISRKHLSCVRRTNRSI